MTLILSSLLVKKLWQTLPKEVKESQTLEILNIKSIILDSSCKLSKTFMVNLCFLYLGFCVHFEQLVLIDLKILLLLTLNKL